MDKIYVVYWSQSGNTQAMAEAVGKGITDAGKEAAVVYVGDASIEDLKNAKCFALGCPAMGAEVLEESEMEPFVSEVEAFASGKTIALFGSCGIAGNLTGGCLNPAIGFGHNFIRLIVTGDPSECRYLWLYILGPACGGILAAIVYNGFFKKYFDEVANKKMNRLELHDDGLGNQISN